MTQVLFVCLHNAGRSQIAQALFERYASATDRARSAGTTPAEQIHPEVLEVMREIGVELSERRPRLLRRELLEEADVVVTMGCGDEFQYIPGKRYIDWELPDPVGRPLDEVRAIRDDIATRVQHLVRNLSSLRADLPSAQAFGLLEEGVLLMSSSGVLLSANPAACALLGRTEKELLSPSFLDELDPETRKAFTTALRGSVGPPAINQRPVRDVIASIAKRDESRVGLALNYQPLLSTSGEIDGMLVSIRGSAGRARPHGGSVPVNNSRSVSQLTARERDVIRLVALGYGGREIARELDISAETVRTHLNNAMAKVGARSRAHLVALLLSEQLGSQGMASGQ